MKCTWKTTGRLSFLPLRDAVLCADCNFVSADEEDLCSVCRGRSLLRLPELLGSQNPDIGFAEGKRRIAEAMAGQGRRGVCLIELMKSLTRS